VPVAHVEAGMRSFDRRMPEELNRVLVDHARDLLLCPSETRRREPARRAGARGGGLVGDVMVDVALAVQPRARASAGRRARPGRSCWRPRTAPATSTIPSAWPRSSTCCARCPCPSSCRCTRARARGSRRPGLLDRLAGAVDLRPPLGLPRLTALLLRAAAPSHRLGGVQKEAYLAACRA
jgi:hypothetical protein